ncbi:MAG: tRNA pseudouridine(38-40) synthase TruA [Actinobacteria bacterium]|nr:tRNA pseudouridine(38-40) synthase TruA [Actinomycetota bacterium]
MNNYAAVLEYDGTGFKGFQLQPKNVRTVQGELLKALGVLLKSFHDFSYAGRTDAGVHARHQVINFKSEDQLDLYRFKWKLNCILPEEIVVKDIKKAGSSFNARKDAKVREYSYYVVNDNYQSVFLRKYSLMIGKPLDLKVMRLAAEKFVGTNDFAAFCNNNFHKSFTVKNVYSFRIRSYKGNILVFKIAANSFLYNMVRIIVGTVLEIGRGQRSLDSIDIAFKSKDRKLAGKIAPAKGLFLTGVSY